jgi:F420-dependent oxidoreductase-like protein
MRFSLCLKEPQPFREIVEIVTHAERTGWDGVWYTDHFMVSEDMSTPRAEAWMTLAALATRVPRIRVGTLVSGNTYRHPAVVAKMAATLDHISGGRMVLGLGSSWHEIEHRQYGIPFYTVAERLQRLDEACTVIKSLFNRSESNFDGHFYKLVGGTLEPKPVQNPLPLLIGGGGEKMTLMVAAKHADEWNIWGTVDTLKHKMDVLDRHCREIGRDPGEIERSAVASLFMSDDRVFIDEMKIRYAGRPTIIGSLAEVKNIVKQYEAIGINELIVPDFTLGPGKRKIATMDAFIKGVAAR